MHYSTLCRLPWDGYLHFRQVRVEMRVIDNFVVCSPVVSAGLEAVIMDEATKQDAYGGYGFTIRTFWVCVSDLHLHSYWSRESSITGKPEFSRFVSGKAVTKDRVSVIGRESAINEFDFALRVDTDAKEQWEWLKGHDTLAYEDHSKYKPEHIRIKTLIEERLDSDPPTAALSYTEADREIGTTGGWWIECKVPPEVLDKLAYEISSKTVDTISIGVKWTAGLVYDEHAPPSFPTVWGLFCLGENRGPEPLQGHVSSIKWSPSPLLETTSDDNNLDAPTSMSTPEATVTPVIFNVPKSAIAALWVIALVAALHLFK